MDRQTNIFISLLLISVFTACTSTSRVPDQKANTSTVPKEEPKVSKRSNVFNVRLGELADPRYEKLAAEEHKKCLEKPNAFCPIRAGILQKRAEVEHEVAPKYPKQALQAGIEGTVVLRVAVTKKGNVHSARVLKGLGHGLDQAAIAAIKEFRFEPAIADGKEVDSIIVYKISFVILPEDENDSTKK